MLDGATKWENTRFIIEMEPRNEKIHEKELDEYHRDGILLIPKEY